MAYIDAHNHLQDERFNLNREDIMAECFAHRVSTAVVNGSCPHDWPLVAALAKRYPQVVPCFGVHPWYVNDLPADWKTTLVGFLDSMPSAIGEIGIDGWKKEFNTELQERIFIEQLELAAARNLPVSIHGLRRWGRLLEILARSPRPQSGFLLHSYGGPLEMIKAFADLGAYFSCPGLFLQHGREAKLSVFRAVPEERLLLETDAPDQNLPLELDKFQLLDPTTGARINHPANIIAVYQGVASLRNISVETLKSLVAANFKALFGSTIMSF